MSATAATTTGASTELRDRKPKEVLRLFLGLRDIFRATAAICELWEVLELCCELGDGCHVPRRYVTRGSLG